MKKLIITLLSTVLVYGLSAQCEFIDMSVSASTETQIQLYTPSPFFIPSPGSNEHFWDISDSNGNSVIQETTDSDGNLFLFQHSVPLTDTVFACLTITNEIAGPGISCTVCDSLTWQGDIINWAFLNNGGGGTFEATQPPVPNYFVVGQSAPCPPRVINFQNFTFGSDEILWTFPGGDPASSTENNQLVTYNSPGDFSFTIEVTNGAGSASFTSTDEVTVFPNPVADFEVTTSEFTASFENLSAAELNPGQSIDYLWDFGDENTSTEENPMHTYAESGIYDVTLSVTNQCGTAQVDYEVFINIIGVEEYLEEITLLAVVPNPNNGQFEVVIEGKNNTAVNLRLTNLAGQTVLEKSAVLFDNQLRTSINSEAITAGVYFLSVGTSENSATLRVVVE